MEIILQYFPELSSEQQQKFRELESLYRDWNEKINLVSRKDIDHLCQRHILHSLAIAKVIRFKSMTSVLDVGTGGGFPGIPLAIFFPEVKFHLIDSIGKKIKVVQDISEKLSLQNVKAQQIRAEEVEDQYDFVVSRAVTRLKPFYGWVRDKFLKGGFNSLDNGILYLKGGELEEELKELGKKAKAYDLSDFFKEEFFETKKVVYIPVAKS